MAENIRRYITRSEGYSNDRDMILTAIVGSNFSGASIQFTIGSEYCVMSQQQLMDLIDTIKIRIANSVDYDATGDTNMKVVMRDGSVKEE